MNRQLGIVILVIAVSIVLGWLLRHTGALMFQSLLDFSFEWFDRSCEFGRPRMCGSGASALLLLDPFITASQAIIVASPIGYFIHRSQKLRNEDLGFYRSAGAWLILPTLLTAGVLFSIDDGRKILVDEGAWIAMSGLVSGFSCAWVIWFHYRSQKK